jgi:threonylcarbamoyladenosine tRNA methylthiotransferase MtaB
LLLDNSDKDVLFDKLSRACPQSTPITPSAEELGEGSLVALGAAHRRRAFVKVQEGCDERCSYCIVPKARGTSRSRDPEDIAAEIQRLSATGYREVILVGVHLGDFGSKLDAPQNLGNLLRRLCEVPGLGRVRLSSVEPDAVTDEFVDALSHPKVCRHLHLPIQSGSDRILRAMRRPYGIEDVRAAAERLRNKLPDIGLGADFIMGFPGETETDFSETYALVDKLPLSYLHVFPYSPRPDTEAVTLPNQIPSEERDRRVRALNLLGKTKGAEFVRSRIGKRYQAWFYPGPPRAPELLRGLTTNYLRVLVAASTQLINEFAEVRLTGFSHGELSGELVQTN